MHIRFITDGDSTTGMGHVQQSTTFAKHLRDRVDRVSFLTKSGKPALDLIRSAGFDVERIDDDAGIFARLRQGGDGAVVFDKIDVDDALAAEIRTSTTLGLAIFTNLSTANRHADLAVTADIGSDFQNVRFTDESTGTLYYYGPKYWVLRPEFYEFARRGKPRPSQVDRALLIFGGSDPVNATSAALDRLLDSKRTLAIDVVLGSAFPHEHDVLSLLDSRPDRRGHVRILRNVRNVAELMYEADLVLASPGLSAFEALRVGTPVLVVPQDELQRKTYQGHMKLLDRNDMGDLIDRIDSHDFTYPSEEKIASMEIGEGVAELVNEVVRIATRANR